MAGKITVSTINDSSGVLATQNGMTGIAKAWVNFVGAATPTINGSFNVSSITYNIGGDYTINFTTALPNANYATLGATSAFPSTYAGYTCVNRNGSTGAFVTPTTTSCRINTLAQNLTSCQDSGYQTYVAVLGA